MEYLSKDVVLVAVETQGEDKYSRRDAVLAFSKWVQEYYGSPAEGSWSSAQLEQQNFPRAGVISSAVVLESAAPGSHPHAVIPGGEWGLLPNLDLPR